MRIAGRFTRLAAASMALFAEAATGADLPVRSVVLYKHGVGYFERAGALAAGESARLDFKAEEMNDVLKSLTVDDNAGKVNAIRYDSNIPLEQKLNEFPFRIGSGQPLSSVLGQLQGAQVELDFGPQKIAGEIVTARTVPGEKERPEREQLTLLLASGEMRTVDLSAATGFRFVDARLRDQFKGYLGALTGARSKDRRSVYIDSRDARSRQVRASYIMPMPAWKSSYRLLFGDTVGAPTLEGWAIVDNTTGEDWTNVHVSLVSGKPISFITDLYDPRYIERASAQMPEDRAVAPALHGGAMDAMAPPAGAPRAMARNLSGGGGAKGVTGGVLGGIISGSQPGEGSGLGGGRFMTGEAAQAAAQVQASSIALAGQGTEVADLFEYSIGTPVSVRKNESAMLPFLQQKIKARKLILYADSSQPHPLSAAEITNDTGRMLDGGPVTVYDSGAYAGEALVESIKSNDKRFISYGVDLGTRIATTLGTQSNDVRELHVHNGILTTRSALVQKKVYSIRNVDNRAKTLIVEHPVRPNYQLRDTPKPLETARDVYRFEIPLPASGAVDFPVTEENVYDQQTSVSSITPDALLVYVRNQALTAAARQQLGQLADLKRQQADLENERRRLDTDLQNLARDEERSRQNIASLSTVSGQQSTVQEYARKLSDQETQIVKARERQSVLDGQQAQLRAQINAVIEQLDF